MITGREDIASIDRAYTVGATSFVTKPIKWRQLSYQLRYVVRASKKDADRRLSGEDGVAATAISGATREELVTCLNAIIATANTIAAGRAPTPEVARAGEIMAAAEFDAAQALGGRSNARHGAFARHRAIGDAAADIPRRLERTEMPSFPPINFLHPHVGAGAPLRRLMCDRSAGVALTFGLLAPVLFMARRRGR